MKHRVEPMQLLKIGLCYKLDFREVNVRKQFTNSNTVTNHMPGYANKVLEHDALHVVVRIWNERIKFM